MNNYNRPTGSSKFFTDKSYNNISESSKDGYTPASSGSDPSDPGYRYYTPSPSRGGLSWVFKFLFKTFLVLFGIYLAVNACISIFG